MTDTLLIASRQVALPDGALSPAAVTIDDTGRIAAVHALPTGSGYKAALDALAHAHGWDAAAVDDLGDDLLTPAFIDGHVHLPLVVLRGAGVQHAAAGNVVEDLFYRVEAHYTPEDVRAFARMGAYEALLSGTGLVWEHYFKADALAEGIAEVGLSAVIAPTLQDIVGPGVGSADAQLDATVRLAKGEGPKGTFAALGPHAPDTVSRDLWRRVADTAEKHQLPVHAHLAQTLDELKRVSAREGADVTPVSLLLETGVLDAAPTALLVHALFVSGAELDALAAARARVHMGFCPRSQQIFAFPANPSLWEARALPWILGTDCAASNDALSVPRELAICAALRGPTTARGEAYRAYLSDPSPVRAEAVWTARQSAFAKVFRRCDPPALLRRVWDLPGAMHPGVRAGVIRPGALANIVAWNTSHPAFWPASDPLRTLVYGNPVPAIRQVMTMGTWRGTRGDFARSIVESDAYKAHHAEATERRTALLDAWGG